MRSTRPKLIWFRLVALTLFIASNSNASIDASAEAADLNVMSFNIRYSRGGPQEEAAENDWNDPKHPRRERAIQVIREYNPDILGVQEARHIQIVDLRETMPAYDFYGIGRDDGKTGGEYSGIFYRKDQFKREDAGSFWLSATPEKPGTSFYTVPDAVPRIASWVKLRDKESDREFVVLNAHWDHISVPARRKSAALMRARLAELGHDLPAIVMGDFNAVEETAEVVEILGNNDTVGRKLIDSYRKLYTARSPQESTFNFWKGTTKGSRIDFILHTDDLAPTAADIVRTSYDGRLPSDHYPVTATLRFEDAPEQK